MTQFTFLSSSRRYSPYVIVLVVVLFAGLALRFIPDLSGSANASNHTTLGDVAVCTSTLSPTSASFDFPGGSGSVNLTTTCAWTAVSNVAWIGITSSPTGTGNGTISYMVAANPSPTSPRTGSMTIAGKTFYVQQAAPGLIISEDFSNGIPLNWTVVDGGTNNGLDNGSHWTTTNPCHRTGLTPPFAIIDPACAGPGTIPDDELRLPEFDATGLGQVLLQFDSRVHLLNGTTETADVDVSINHGTTWTNALRISGDEPATPKTIDITQVIPANSPSVLIRFHYYLFPACIPACTKPGAPNTGDLVSEWEYGFPRLSYIKLTPAAVTRQQGSPASSSIIAHVTAIPDVLPAGLRAPVPNTLTAKNHVLNTITVTVNGGSFATVNGVTVSEISLNSAGVVTANIVVASCDAATANFTLTATDSAMISTNATLTVTVTGNTAPTLGTYPTTTVAANGSTTVTPSAPPSDNGSIMSLTASAPGFTGSFSGNTTTGVITVTNASPAGNYTVTVTATDNCGAIATKTFLLGVGAQTITVNTTADTVAADGFCSLREAIQAANTNLAVNECSAGAAGLDNIVFNLGAGGTPAINLTSALPTITQPVNINGNTGGATRVELNGTGAGGSTVGLVITDGNSTVRGLVINRFGESGIAIGGTGGNVIENCYLGTDAAGTAKLGNGRDGVRINGSPNNIIGGTTAAARNLISGNTQYGVLIFNSGATGNQVQGNYIGTDITGTLALGNGLDGVRISSAPNNVIGGAASGARNVISGNAFDGVFLLGAASTGNLVQNNIIGLTANGASALANLSAGVLIDGASNNTIGGTSANLGNVIFSNTGAGIFVADDFGSTTGNAILGNSISSNQGLGIDLAPASAPGVTANDAGDSDTGPNNLQNFPVLTSVTSTGTITGSLDSAIANSAYPVRIEFFGNTVCDGTNGEGEVFLGSTTLAAPGNFTASVTLMAGKNFITATATDNNGNTSEFSSCRKVNTVPAITASTPLTRQQSSAAINSQIASVTDPDQALNTLVVTATALTGTSVTISNIVVSPVGNVTADVAASCGATNSTFMLSVVDNLTEINTATLTVNVTANAVPVLTYNNQSVAAGGSLTINPATGPSDNGTINSITVQSAGTYTGTISVNGSGMVSISSAKLVGAHTITIRATDNCGAFTDANFTLTVGCVNSLTVNNTGDGADATPGDGICETATNNGVCTLRAAIQEANALTGCTPFTINFSVTGTINLATALPNLNHPGLTINGPGANLLDVHRNSANNFRIFTINSGKTVTLNNLTISNGNAAGSSGGGVFNFGTLTVNSCAIAGNTATFNGGGLQSEGGTLVMNNSTISGNTANGSFGGSGLFNFTGPATLTNCTVSGNMGGPSGSITNYTATGNSSLMLINCTIANNLNSHGGIFNYNNSGTNAGSAVTTQLKNTIVANNNGFNFIVGNPEAGNISTITSLGNNLSSDGGLIPATGDKLNTNPLLAPLGNYGGPTQTHALLCNSPAIDAGTASGAPATDQRGVARPQGAAFDIGAFEANISISPMTLPTAIAGTGYSQMLTATGGTPSYSFSVIAGALPTWATLSAGGVLSGTPNAAGTFNFTIQATGAGGFAGACAFTLTVNCPTITITPTTLLNGTLGSPYNQGVTASGGTAPYTFIVLSGTLPTGLSLSTSGILSGTPTAFGTFNFTAKATDANSCIGTQAYTLTIICQTLTVNPVTIPNGFAGALYNQTLTASNGAAPYTFTISAGAAPGGLSLSLGGVLSGTPSAAGTFNFTVKTTDTNGCMGTRAYTVTIGSGLQFYPLPHPIRLFDTRAPVPGFPACAYLNQPLQGDVEFVRQARITCDGITIPATAKAIVGNATVINPQGGGFAILFPNGQPRPTASNINFAAGQIIANSFTIGLGDDGQFRVYPYVTTDFIVDITGYFAPPGAEGLYYHPLPSPIRLFDTRTPIPGFPACAYLSQPLQGNVEFVRQARITCDGITIPNDAQVIVGNSTVVNPVGGGFAILFPNGQPRPTASNINYATGQVIANAFTVGLGSDGQFRVYPFTTTDFVVDITGYYSLSPADGNGTGLLYEALPRPIRLFDTRAPIPGFPACAYLNQSLPGGQEFLRQARITCDGITIPVTAEAITGNSTVVNPVGGGFATLFPNGQPRPNASNINYAAGQVIANAFTLRLGGDGQFRVYPFTTTDFVVDITGYFRP